MHVNIFQGLISALKLPQKYKVDGVGYCTKKNEFPPGSYTYNLKVRMSLSGFENLSCFFNKLYSVIKDAVFSQRSANNLIQKCKIICTYFKHSNLRCSEPNRLEKEIDPNIVLSLLPIQYSLIDWMHWRA